MPFFALISTGALLARVELSDVARRSREIPDASSNLELIVWVAVAIAMLWAAINYWSRFRDRFLRQSDSPKSLFLELCRVHRLDRAEKSFLLAAVEAARLSEPAVVFINPDILASTEDAQQGRALAEKLFGQNETG